MKRLLLLTLSVIVAGFVLPASLNAQSAEWISSFDSNITINKDNSANITETIVYDFGSNAKHGIKRYVPIKNKAGNRQYYLYDIQFIDTKQDDKSVNVETIEENNTPVLKIGDPVVTITGKHAYTINYKIMPVVQSEDDNDYLNLNITGNQWPVTVLKTSATINFENDIKPTKVECYSGEKGSKDQSSCNIEQDGSVVNIKDNQPLNAGAGVTANILLPKDSYDNYLVAQNKPLPNLWPAVGPLVAVCLIIFAVIVRIAGYLKHKRLQRREVVVPQYEAPDGLSPGEVGQLSDNSSDLSEITASIISLAVKGQIKIEQVGSKTLFKKAKYKFHNLKKDTSALPSHERKLLNLILPSNIGSYELDKVSPSTAQATVMSVKKTLKKQLESKGYYLTADSPARINWRLLIGIGGAITIIANIIALFVGGTLFIYIFLSIAVALIGGGFAETITKRITVTESGYDKWAEVEGLKMYLQVAEKDWLEFHNAPEKNPKLFNELLPYAIALGVEDKWAKQFESLNIDEQSTDWYAGTGKRLSTAAFVSGLSSDFGGAVSSGFAPAQSSGVSSGGSSGGFSGGGIGGGGGGSW